MNLQYRYCNTFVALHGLDSSFPFNSFSIICSYSLSPAYLSRNINFAMQIAVGTSPDVVGGWNMWLSISTRPDLMGTGTFACWLPRIPLQIPPTHTGIHRITTLHRVRRGWKPTFTIFFHSAPAFTNDCGDWKFRQHICCRLQNNSLTYSIFIPRNLQTDNVLPCSSSSSHCSFLSQSLCSCNGSRNSHDTRKWIRARTRCWRAK